MKEREHKRILLVLGEPLVINFDQDIIHHLNQPSQAIRFSDLDETEMGKSLNIKLEDEQLERYEQKFGKDDAETKIVFWPGYLTSGVRWEFYEWSQMQLFNQKYQDIAKILSPAQSSRFINNIPPTISIHQKEWLVEGYNNLLRQVEEPSNTLHGFDQRSDFKGRYYLMFDKENYSAPKSGWQEDIYSLEDCAKYDRIVLNDSIVKMDPVGRAQREGKPWGFYCMNSDFKMSYESYSLILFGDYFERIIDQNRMREGMPPFNHHPAEREIPLLIRTSTASNNLKQGHAESPKQKNRKSQGRKA